MTKFLKSAIATSTLVFAGVASAASATFDFTTLQPFAGGASGTGNSTVGCGFNSGYDICGTALSFQQGSFTAVATGTYLGASKVGNVPVRVVQDYDHTDTKGTALKTDDVLHFAGLGVYHKVKDTSDDNVTTGEVLKLTFNTTVKLTGLNLSADGHGVYNKTGNTFLLNNTPTTLAGSFSGLSLVGTTFTFAYGGAHPDQFYLRGLTVAAVPEPETYAMLLSGLGVLGAVARRRKAKRTA